MKQVVKQRAKGQHTILFDPQRELSQQHRDSPLIGLGLSSTMSDPTYGSDSAYGSQNFMGLPTFDTASFNFNGPSLDPSHYASINSDIDRPAHVPDQYFALAGSAIEELWLDSSPLLSKRTIPVQQSASAENHAIDKSMEPLQTSVSSDFSASSSQHNFYGDDSPSQRGNSPIGSFVSASKHSYVSALKFPFTFQALPTVEERKEADILMHYLDYTFHEQFPFYDSAASRHGRGWLLNLLMRDKAVYYAALSLSQYHMNPSGPEPECVITEIGISPYQYYMMALTELQGSMEVLSAGDGSWIRKIHALACSVYLLFFEV